MCRDLWLSEITRLTLDIIRIFCRFLFDIKELNLEILVVSETLQ